MKFFFLIFVNVIIVFDSYSQWIKSNIPDNEYVSSIIHYYNILLASTTYKVNENIYCKIYQSGDCGDTWNEVLKTQQFKYIKMFAYKETVYFISQTTQSVTIGSTIDTFKTNTSTEIPELRTRIVYDFYVFDGNKILIAYNKGIGIYEQAVFQPFNLNKFGKNASSQIRFYSGNVFVDYGESILFSEDTCKTWKKYFEFKYRDCLTYDDKIYHLIHGFDLLNNLLVINRGNADCFSMYYCDTSKRDSLIKIEKISTSNWARPVVLENKIFGLPFYEEEKGIYYLDENFVPVFLHSGLQSDKRNSIAILQMISCNKSIIIGTSNGIYKLKNTD